MSKEKTKKVQLIVAEAHKIKASDSLIICISPEFADLGPDLYEELERITGHQRHSIFPLPKDALRVYRVEHDVHVEIDPAFALKPEGEIDE